MDTINSLVGTKSIHVVTNINYVNGHHNHNLEGISTTPNLNGMAGVSITGSGIYPRDGGQNHVCLIAVLPQRIALNIIVPAHM